MQGVDTLCVEGSHDGVMSSWLPEVITEKRRNESEDVDEAMIQAEIDYRITEHDFSRGPWYVNTNHVCSFFIV